jgi:DNA polymerase III epsilon subunit family exonuclease
MMLFERSYTALDFETTGLDGGADRIVEIGAVRFDRQSESGAFSALVNPGFLIDPRVTAINGISNDMLEGQPSEETELPKLISFLEDSVVIAHNAPFDVGFLVAACKRLNLTLPPFLVLDTLTLARRILPGRRSYALQSLGESFALVSGQSHRALDDARLCMQLFRVLAQEKNFDWENPDSLRELSRSDRIGSFL